MAGVGVRLEVLGGVLHHVLDGVLPPVADPAEELQTVGRPESLPLYPGLVDLQVVHHHGSVREQNVEIAELAVDPQIERNFEIEKIIFSIISHLTRPVGNLQLAELSSSLFQWVLTTETAQSRNYENNTGGYLGDPSQHCCT